MAKDEYKDELTLYLSYQEGYRQEYTALAGSLRRVKISLSHAGNKMNKDTRSPTAWSASLMFLESHSTSLW